MSHAHIKAEQLAAEKWPGRPDGDIPLTNMKRKAFIDGYMSAIAEADQEAQAEAKLDHNRRVMDRYMDNHQHTIDRLKERWGHE